MRLHLQETWIRETPTKVTSKVIKHMRLHLQETITPHIHQINYKLMGIVYSFSQQYVLNATKHENIFILFVINLGTPNIIPIYIKRILSATSSEFDELCITIKFCISDIKLQGLMNFSSPSNGFLSCIVQIEPM